MAKFDPAIHDDNPPLDAAFMAGMKPSRRGRPRLDAPKVEVKIRLDASTAEHLRGSGPGWQTRVNALLGELVAGGRIKMTTDWPEASPSVMTRRMASLKAVALKVVAVNLDLLIVVGNKAVITLKYAG